MANPPRISDRERERVRKLVAEGRTKASIGKIIGRSRMAVIRICRGQRDAPGGKKRSAPHSQAAKMRWAKAPSNLTDQDIADAFGPE